MYVFLSILRILIYENLSSSRLIKVYIFISIKYKKGSAVSLSIMALKDSIRKVDIVHDRVDYTASLALSLSPPLSLPGSSGSFCGVTRTYDL